MRRAESGPCLAGARKEFEEARNERDPLIGARLLVVGREALQKIQERHRDLEEEMKHIASTRGFHR